MLHLFGLQKGIGEKGNYIFELTIAHHILFVFFLLFFCLVIIFFIMAGFNEDLKSIFMRHLAVKMLIFSSWTKEEFFL